MITLLVLCWTLVFQYETLRASYLGPWLKRELPKLPLLFPPAGWIMFYRVDRSYGYAEVYGVRDPGGREEPVLLDPHDIFETRAVGYDNIHRNVLVGVLSRATVGTTAQCARLRQERPRDYQAAVLDGICREPAEEPAGEPRFCAYLRRKFPAYGAFAVVYAEYPDVVETPEKILRQVAYRCP